MSTISLAIPLTGVLVNWNFDWGGDMLAQSYNVQHLILYYFSISVLCDGVQGFPL